ncbi:MAG: aminopeptidase P family N-terminal domain-containing protein, partial [Proteobacteria bacterium]|nr:aminopeptidase P family N-terminal domain-containing protein [Pseudomonadota bacterium]
MKKEIKMHLDRIQNLKNLFSKYEIDALIIPSCDEFQNSFIRENRAHLEWFSGFTGSNGSLIITESFNIFLTDGRYIDQSKKELKISCEIFNIGSKDALGDAMKMLSSMRVGYFSELNTCKNFNFYRKYALQNDFQILPLENDAMLDFFKEAWSITNTIPTKVYDLELKYSGTSVPEKIEKISSLMSRDANYIIISDLNEIAWTLNLRGRSDVPFTPVFFSRLIIGKEGQIFLFTESNVNTDYAKQNNIEIKNLTEVYDFYKDLLSDGQVIQFDYESTPARFLHMSEDTQIRIAKSPVDELKSVKNATELQGMKDASFLEGVAICKLFCWMYRNIGDNITEIDASNKLEEFRKQSDLFLYPSFQTISAFGENASIIHYKPNENTNKTITGNDLYLIDAGGQYFCGTTDATRVICFGTPTDEQRINFTNVLKGYIRLANAKFPKRTICA